MKIGVCILTVLAGSIGLMVAPVNAAYLDRKPEQRTDEKTQPQEVLKTCTCTAMSNITSTLGPNNQSFEITADEDASASSDEPDCSNACLVSSLMTNTFEILPDPGENPGDPVRMCVTFASSQQSVQEGDSRAETTFGGVPLLQPLLIRRVPGTTVFEVGPLTVGGNDEQVIERECHIGTRIGELLEVRSGFSAFSGNDGIGDAAASLDVELEMAIGSCPDFPPCALETTPALSRLNLAAACILLASLGGVLVRRRAAVGRRL